MRPETRISIVRTLAALSLACGLSACDYLDGRDLKKERSARAYRTSMDDYRAGRIPQAIEGLKKVCHDDPSNASARFQLACLLQDSVKDYFGAACAYREYLQQCPGSDKGRLASERLSVCERELAQVLASKYGLNDVAARAKEIESLRAELKDSAGRVEKLQGNLSDAMQRISQLSDESERLKKALRRDDPVSERPNTDVTEAMALLQAESEEAAATPSAAAEAAALIAEEKEELSAGSTLLVQPADAKAKRAEAKAAEDQKRQQAAADRPRHPDTYVVQEGDTLYKLAVRFYGRSAAWQKIREANKAIISTDGRIRAGQKLVLPE